MSTVKEWNHRLIYTDTFSAYDFVWTEDQGAACQKQSETPYIEGAPCYLSVMKNSLGNRRRLDQPQGEEGDRNIVERTLMIFCDPHYSITAGDAMVVNHCGQVFQGVAGEPHKYNSHQELILYTLEDA